jgi:hypothetical protein
LALAYRLRERTADRDETVGAEPKFDNQMPREARHG